MEHKDTLRARVWSDITGLSLMSVEMKTYERPHARP